MKKLIGVAVLVVTVIVMVMFKKKKVNLYEEEFPLGI